MLQLQPVRERDGQNTIGFVAICDWCHTIIECHGEHWKGQYHYDLHDLNFKAPQVAQQGTRNIYCTHAGQCNRSFEHAYEQETGRTLSWGELADLVVFLGNNVQVDWEKLKPQMAQNYPK